MTDEEIRNTAIHALDWAKGSWGQGGESIKGLFCKAPYDDETMAKIWYQIADIARDRAIKFDCDYVAKTELK